jgi:glycine hydroxymethyltransferase
MGGLSQVDSEIYQLIKEEEQRQSEKIRLIPSENYVSKAVLEATGSVLTNKYSEGYPQRRYYEGQQVIDKVEELAIARAKELFGVKYVNVQPYSGSPANLAVYFATLKPGDTVMGMMLPHGGHLTHGWDVSITGKYFRSVQYSVRPDTGLIDYDEVRELALAERPKLIWAGGTAYPRIIDFSVFGEIAREIEAYFCADIAHIAGLIIGGVHPSPLPHAHIITTTTHKTLRGPRGAMIMTDSDRLAQMIDRAVFPGLQGGPHNHTTAGIAVALKEALQPEFKEYAVQVVKNAKALAEELLAKGYQLISGGTDTHLILINIIPKGLIGKKAARILDEAGIVTNRNTIPYDPRSPFSPSGIRLGTPSVTSRGMKEPEMKLIAEWIDKVITSPNNKDIIQKVREEIKEFLKEFPAPGIMV